MLVQLKRNVMLNGTRFRKAERGTKIPGQFAGQLPADAELIDATDDERSAFEKSQKAHEAKVKERLSRPRPGSPNVPAPSPDTADLVKELKALRAEVKSLNEKVAELQTEPEPAKPKADEKPAEKPAPKI